MFASESVKGLAAVLFCFICVIVAEDGPECGRALGRSSSPRKSEDVIPGWHAVVYGMANGVGKDICAGALIDSKFVLAAEHCFYGPSGNLRPEADFTVAVGKVSRVLDREEISSQTRMIKRIHTPQSASVAHSSDFALVELNEGIFLNDRVWPICIDWEGDQLPPQNGDTGSMAGFGTGDSLQYFPLRFVDKHKCKLDNTEDSKAIAAESKFCASDDKDSTFNGIESTCGFAQKSQDRWFLRGVFSKTSKTTHLFSNVTGYVDWMSDVIFSEK